MVILPLVETPGRIKGQEELTGSIIWIVDGPYIIEGNITGPFNALGYEVVVAET
jgi:hypothetical protein